MLSLLLGENFIAILSALHPPHNTSILQTVPATKRCSDSLPEPPASGNEVVEGSTTKRVLRSSIQAAAPLAEHHYRL